MATQQTVQEMEETLGQVPDLYSLLLVPANVREKEASAIVQNYRVLNPGALVLTKTDEAASCDGLTRLCDVAGIPIVYLTNGQRVPEDLQEASKELIVNQIWRCECEDHDQDREQQEVTQTTEENVYVG